MSPDDGFLDLILKVLSKTNLKVMIFSVQILGRSSRFIGMFSREEFILLL
jgi:hypothetical protein